MSISGLYKRITAGLTSSPKSEDHDLSSQADLEQQCDGIICKYSERVTVDGYNRAHQIENLTRDCMREIIALHPEFGPSPLPGEYLRNWRERTSQSSIAERISQSIEQRFHNRETQLKKERQDRDAERGQQLLDQYFEIVDRFLEIAERKISRLDEYGDEQLHLLKGEVDACVAKIAGRTGLDEQTIKKDLRKHSYGLFLSEPLRWVRSRLPQIFAEYHEKQRGNVRARTEVEALAGIDFEAYLARVLVEAGWRVSTTPAAGDQGADLIAIKDERCVVIQAKRYSGLVGNFAVQEVLGALGFYNATEACVVTNSDFTPSARALAQKNNIRLIDGSQLARLSEL